MLWNSGSSVKRGDVEVGLVTGGESLPATRAEQQLALNVDLEEDKSC